MPWYILFAMALVLSGLYGYDIWLDICIKDSVLKDQVGVTEVLDVGGIVENIGNIQNDVVTNISSHMSRKKMCINAIYAFSILGIIFTSISLRSTIFHGIFRSKTLRPSRVCGLIILCIFYYMYLNDLLQ